MVGQVVLNVLKCLGDGRLALALPLKVRVDFLIFVLDVGYMQRARRLVRWLVHTDEHLKGQVCDIVRTVFNNIGVLHEEHERGVRQNEVPPVASHFSVGGTCWHCGALTPLAHVAEVRQLVIVEEVGWGRAVCWFAVKVPVKK